MNILKSDIMQDINTVFFRPIDDQRMQGSFEKAERKAQEKCSFARVLSSDLGETGNCKLCPSKICKI